MGPHDLLCKWCSTFVGKDKKFCSIFCESRFTRSKRRKLAIKRPTQSGPAGQSPEFESPRTSKTNFTKKEQFLDDVITAMKIVADTPDEKNKYGRLLDSVKEESEEANTSSARKIAIPRLDLNSARKEREGGVNSARKSDGDKPEMLKSKTRTIYKNRGDSKIPVITNAKPDAKDGNKKLADSEKKETPNAKRDTDKTAKQDTDKNVKRDTDKTAKQNTDKNAKQNDKYVKKDTDKPVTQDTDNKASEKRDKSAIKQTDGKIVKPIKPGSDNNEAKENVPEFGVPAPITKTKSALDLEHRIKSSGYGAPVNPKLRPMSLKAKSASFITNAKRQSSASSVKSFKAVELRSKKLDALPDLIRETSRPIDKGTGKWELIPKTIEEETNKTVKDFLNTSLEDQSPTSSSRLKTGKKSTERTDRSELKILREESTASDLLDTSQIQDRLSSIKRKVEARRRGRDSRSSIGSDFDSSFLDSSIDLTTDRDVRNTSNIKSKALSARLSARSNITRISKSFQPNKEPK